MICATPGNTQVYSPFGTYVVEQRDEGLLRRFLEDLPRPDLKFGAEHPLGRREREDLPDSRNG
jgi:hypothetical protein